MSRTLISRLQNEMKDMKKSPPPNCRAGPVSSGDLMNWQATITGPEGTPYAGGKFKLNILITPEYPIKPPKVRFTTKIYHPNINESGSVCLDILKDKWSPANTISSVLLSVLVLLQDPNPNDPLVPEIGNEYKTRKAQFLSKARQWTNSYAK